MQTPPPQALTYAKPLGWHQRRRVQRILLSLALVTAALTVFAAWGPRVWEQWRYLRLQAQCLNYANPPDKVVYTEYANEGSTLLAMSPEYQRTPYPGTIAGTDWDPVGFTPRPLLQWMMLPNGEATPFLHRLRSPNGQERLVSVLVITRNHEEFGQGRSLVLIAEVLKCADWRFSSRIQPINDSTLDLKGLEPGDRVRLFAGQLDPSDPSRFSIEYDLNGTTGTIRGELLDGGHVRLSTPSWPRS